MPQGLVGILVSAVLQKTAASTLLHRPKRDHTAHVYTLGLNSSELAAREKEGDGIKQGDKERVREPHNRE